MVSDINALDNVVTLLTDNYNTANTDTITPLIAKIYTKPTSKEPTPDNDFIFVYSDITLHDSPGMNANTLSDITEIVKIDIRSRPSNTTQANKINDAHARKVLVEVKRILFSNIVNPDSDFDVIDPSIELTDLSNGMRGIFRYVLKINLTDYCRDMTT